MKKKDILQILFPEKKYSSMQIKDILEDIRKMDNAVLKRWVDSNHTDFGIYKDPNYRCELFYAYMFVSGASMAGTIKFIKSIMSLEEFSKLTVFEHYPGLGLSLLKLYPYTKNLFFSADNADDQTDYMKKYFDFYNRDFSVVKEDGCPDMQHDLVISLEIAEHEIYPFRYANKICKKVKKGGYLIFSTGFANMYPGHFKEYYDLYGNLINSRTTGRNLNKYIKSLGFELVFKGFNQKPRIFQKKKRRRIVCS